VLRHGATYVDLVDNVITGPGSPVPTGLCRYGWDLNEILDIVRSFKDVPHKTGTQMPCDVAVKWPHTRIVCDILDDDVLSRKQHLDITTLGIAGSSDSAIPAAAIGVQGSFLMPSGINLKPLFGLVCSYIRFSGF